MRRRLNALLFSKIMKESKKITSESKKIVIEAKKMESSDTFDEHIKNRRLFSRKVLPMGVRGDGEAKMVVDSLVPHERRLIYEQLRRRVVEQYAESPDRVTVAAVPNHELVQLWYVYLIPSITVGVVSTVILIAVGELFDRSAAQILGLSILGSAAIGNMLSNVVNIFLSNIVFPKYMEPLLGFFGIKRPMLSIDQWRCRHTIIVVNAAKVLGVVVGSLIGMSCLLFINSPHRYDMEHEDEKGAHEELEDESRSQRHDREPSGRYAEDEGTDGVSP